MHYSLARVSAAVLTAAVLCGCSAKSAAKITMEAVEYDTDISTIYAERPVFSFMKNRSLAEEINTQYEKETDDALSSFDTTVNENEPLPGGNKYVFDLRQSVKYNENNFISIVSEIYQYTGGAHGASTWSARNIDVLTGNEILLGDLFADDNYKSVLDRIIEEEVVDNPDEYGSLWEKPQIKESNQNDFYLNDDGLVIFYQPYDLSYYARGFVEFTIDYDDILSYMNPEYQRLASADI